MPAITDRLTLDIPAFEGLRPGDIQLSAPVANGVIQVGWSRTDAEGMPKVPLLVHVEGDARTESVSVTRVDGNPLQIQVLSGELGSLVMHDVSEQPVTSLVFLATKQPHQWDVNAGPDSSLLLDNGSVKRVAEVVARFVRQKQTEQQ